MLLNDEWQKLLEDYREYHDNPVCELTHMVGIPLIVASIPAMVRPRLGLKLFAAGWALQLIGHRFQGNPPKFLGDRRNLLVGVIWWVDAVTRATGVSKAA